MEDRFVLADLVEQQPLPLILLGEMDYKERERLRRHQRPKMERVHMDVDRRRWVWKALWAAVVIPALLTSRRR